MPLELWICRVCLISKPEPLLQLSFLFISALVLPTRTSAEANYKFVRYAKTFLYTPVREKDISDAILPRDITLRLTHRASYRTEII